MSRDSAGHGDGMEAVEFVTELLDLVQSPQAFHLYYRPNSAASTRAISGVLHKYRRQSMTFDLVRLALSASIAVLALVSVRRALEAPLASDKAALAACLKYGDDFPGNVPGIDAKPSPADHVGHEINSRDMTRRPASTT